MSVEIKISGATATYSSMADVLENAVTGDIITITMQDGDIISGGNANGSELGVDYVISGGTVTKTTGVAGGFIQLYGKTATLTANDVLFYGNTSYKCSTGWMGGGALSTGNDMSDCAEGTGGITVTGCTFTGNSTGDHGGAIHSMAAAVITDCSFTQNSATRGGAVILRQNGSTKKEISGSTFTKNVGTEGGAIYMYLGGGLKLFASENGRNVLTGNRARTGSGGALYVNLGNPTISGTDFIGNSAAIDGGAIYLGTSSSAVNISDTTFSGNLCGGTGGAIYAGKILNINGDVKFLTASDTIYNAGTLTIKNTNYFNASILGNGVFNVKNSVMVFGNTTAIDVAGLTFSGSSNTVKLNGSDVVNFTDQDFSSVNISIDNASFTPGEKITVATGITAIGNVSALYYNDKFSCELSEDGVLSYTVPDPGFAIKVSSSDKDYYTMAAALKDAETGDTVTIELADGDVLYGGNENNGKGQALNYVISGGTISGNAGTAGGFIQLHGADVSLTATGVHFVNNISYHSNTNEWLGGGAICGGDKMATSKGTITIDKCTFTGNSTSENGGALQSMGVLTVTNSEFNNNISDTYGGAVLVRKNGVQRTFSGVSFTGNTAGYGGAVANFLGGITFNGDSGRSTFTNNLARGVGNGGGGGAFQFHVSNGTLAAIDFIGNTATLDGGAIFISVDGTVNLSDATFSGNIAGRNGGAIYVGKILNINGDVKFLTASDTIYNAGTLTIKNTNYFNASILGDGAVNVTNSTMVFGNSAEIDIADLTFSGTNAMTFNGSEAVNFAGEDLSSVAISVNGALWDGSDVTVATGVSAIGNYSISGNDELMLSVVDNNLVLSKMAEQVLAEAKVSGTGNNLVTGGEANIFLAKVTAAAEKLLTTVKGGIINNLVGGAYATDGAATTVGNVELNINGEADVKERVYAGGYLYGVKDAGAAASAAQMTVDSVNVNLADGKASGNVFGGAHTRQYGNASVDSVAIAVTGGTHGRVYGGGWAEGGSKNDVAEAVITISGGYVDYVYGGGANGEGFTTVGDSTITISDNAKVGTIFMSGRYGQSSVTDTVSLTFSGAEKTINRLSGVSSAGIDNATSTIVTLETSLIADCIDFVDKFIINEGASLTANNDFLLGNRNAETGESEGATLFDIITDGVDKDWTAIAGIADFDHAQFAINGVTSEWSDNKMTVGNFTLQRDLDEKTVTLLA